MIRHLLAWLRPDPPGIRHRYRHLPAERYPGEPIRAFRVRQMDRVLMRSEVYDHAEDDERRAA